MKVVVKTKNTGENEHKKKGNEKEPSQIQMKKQTSA